MADPEGFFPVDQLLEQKRRQHWAAIEEARRERNREIVRRFQAGDSRKQVARAFGLSTTTISKVLREAGASSGQKPGS